MTTFRQRHDLLPGAVVSACSYDATGLEPGEHRGMPSPWLTLVVSLSGPVRTMGTVADPGPFEASRATAYDVLVAGLHPVAARVEQPEEQSGVQLALHPLAARRLLGCTAAELTGVGQDGSDVLGAASRELHDRLAEVAPAARLPAVRRWLRERVMASEGPHRGGVRPEVVRVWDLLAASRGRRRVDDLAHEVLLSPRHLRELVRSELGTGPKGLARAFRLDHAVELLAVGVGPADVAARAGYADQAHLARDFSAAVGCSPTRWLAEERRNLQDGGHRNRPG